jgi:hypothetical protein
VLEFASPGLNHVWPVPFQKNLVFDIAQNKNLALKALQVIFQKHTSLNTSSENPE